MKTHLRSRWETVPEFSRIAAQKRSEHKAYLDAQAATWEQADKSSEEETYASPSKGKSRRRRKANPLNPGTHPSQESVRSTARTMLSVAQAVVCVSVAIVVGSMYYTKSEYGRIRPERFGLNLSDLPPGQGLSLRKRKGTTNPDHCKGFGIAKDEYFSQYGGVYCGDIVFEAAVQQAETLTPGVQAAHEDPNASGAQWSPTSGPAQLQKVEMTYKTFDTETNAAEYTWRFWGMHCHDPIPMVAMADMTAGIHVKGATPHFLFWDPARMAWPLPTQIPEVAFGKGVIAVFRTGRTFVKLQFTGQPRHFAVDLTPTFAAKLSDVVAERIELNSPNFAARVARRAATMITRVVRLADKTALKLGKKAVRQAKASVHRVVAAAVEGDPENAMGSVPPNTQQQQQHAGGSAGAGPGDVEREVTLDIEVGDGPIVGLDLAETLEMTNGSDNDYDDIGDIDSSWGMEDGGATLDDSGAGVDFHKLVEYVFMAAAVIGLGFVGANLKAALSADEDDVLDAESEARWSKMSAKHAAMEAELAVLRHRINAQ